MLARTGQDWGLQSSRRSKTGDRDSLVVDRPPLLADRSCYGAARPACRSDRRRWQLVESAPQAAAMPVNLADFTFVQYPAREQAELRVRIKIPSVWFNGLSGAERSVKYDAEAYDFVDAHVFKKNGKSAQTRWPRTTLRTRRMTRRLMRATPTMTPPPMPPLPSEPRTREV